MVVAIYSANLLDYDWTERTQVVWISPLLKPIETGSSPDSEFLSDLTEYLSAYSLAPVQKVADGLEKYDFSPIKAKLIGSVPGRHKNDQKYKFGHFKARSVLRKHAQNCEKTDRIVAQVSSIGSLGAQETSWLKAGVGKKSTKPIRFAKKYVQTKQYFSRFGLQRFETKTFFSG